MCEALIYLLDNIYIRFGTKLYRQIVGIQMGTNCAPLIADLGSTVGFLLLQCSSGVVRHPRDLQVSVATRFCRVFCKSINSVPLFMKGIFMKCRL